MTRPSLSRPVEQILPEWMEEVAPTRAPERLLEESFARTMSVDQVRTYPWDRLHRRGHGNALTGRPRWHAFVGVAAAVIVTFGAAVLVLRPNVGGIGGPSPTPTPTVTPGASATPTPGPTLTPITVMPEALIPVVGPVGIASDGQSVWLFTTAGMLVRIDPISNAIAASVTLTSPASAYQGLAGNATGLWLTNWDTSQVERYDPVTLKMLASIPVDRNPKGVLASDSGVWIANTRGGSVSRIDPATNTVIATTSVGRTGPSGPNWLAEALGSIWVGVPNTGSVYRIDEATNTVLATIAAPPGTSPCGGLAVDAVAGWITSCDGGNLLSRFDPATSTALTPLDLGGRAYTVALVGSAPWIWPTGQDLVRIDPTTNAIDRVVAPGNNFGSQGGDVVIAAGSLWLTDGAKNQVIRLSLSALGG